jgi:hypothetical protein
MILLFPRCLILRVAALKQDERSLPGRVVSPIQSCFPRVLINATSLSRETPLWIMGENRRSSTILPHNPRIRDFRDFATRVARFSPSMTEPNQIIPASRQNLSHNLTCFGLECCTACPKLDAPFRFIFSIRSQSSGGHAQLSMSHISSALLTRIFRPANSGLVKI